MASAKSNYLFMNLANVTSFENIGNFDMSNVAGVASIFANCGSPIELDLSHSNAGLNGPLQNNSTFAGNTSLIKLNLQNVKINVGASHIFEGNLNLSELTIRDYFGFINNEVLIEVPNNGVYSGNWINIGTGTVDNPLGKEVISS